MPDVEGKYSYGSVDPFMPREKKPVPEGMFDFDGNRYINLSNFDVNYRVARIRAKTLDPQVRMLFDKLGAEAALYQLRMDVWKSGVIKFSNTGLRLVHSCQVPTGEYKLVPRTEILTKELPRSTPPVIPITNIERDLLRLGRIREYPTDDAYYTSSQAQLLKLLGKMPLPRPLPRPSPITSRVVYDRIDQKEPATQLIELGVNPSSGLSTAIVRSLTGSCEELASREVATTEEFAEFLHEDSKRRLQLGKLPYQLANPTYHSMRRQGSRDLHNCEYVNLETEDFTTDLLRELFIHRKSLAIYNLFERNGFMSRASYLHSREAIADFGFGLEVTPQTIYEKIYWLKIAIGEQSFFDHRYDRVCRIMEESMRSREGDHPMKTELIACLAKTRATLEQMKQVYPRQLRINPTCGSDFFFQEEKVRLKI